ncbi:MAG: extracellular solute-binding protein [Clostridia bacterium]|nr:extracellular solute-binding protein [Clostridia bacterium]
MKKFSALILCLILCFSYAPLSFAEETVLKVYNWQDYIDEGKDDDGAKISDSVMELWEKDYLSRTGKKVRVQYDTFETNETMLNTLRTGRSDYDLVCPSDYIIQKMISATEKGNDENIAIEKFDISAMPNYTKNVSPYISELFEKNGWTEYSVAYMWGTVGFLYNPETVLREDISTWDFFWNTDYRNRMTCKDVSRDAYVIGSLYVHRDELRKANKKYKKGEISAEELQKIVNTAANDTTAENIANVEIALSDMKRNIYGFEVDSGKTDIVSGKIHANLAWSGDAVYAMDLAEEEDGKELEFVIPNEGSTIYFDGWVMPKGANVELAQDFVDFLCRPEIAVMNMDYIGYTSAIAGDEIFDLVCENYEEEDGEYEYDLSYFFNGTLSEDKYTDGKAIIRTNTFGRQLTTQYPSTEEVARCGIMEDFGDRNEAVLEMWSKVKSNNITAFSYVMMAFLALVAVFMLTSSIKKKLKKKKRMRR